MQIHKSKDRKSFVFYSRQNQTANFHCGRRDWALENFAFFQGIRLHILSWQCNETFFLLRISCWIFHRSQLKFLLQSSCRIMILITTPAHFSMRIWETINGKVLPLMGVNIIKSSIKWFFNLKSYLVEQRLLLAYISKWIQFDVWYRWRSSVKKNIFSSYRESAASSMASGREMRSGRNFAYLLLFSTQWRFSSIRFFNFGSLLSIETIW